MCVCGAGRLSQRRWLGRGVPLLRHLEDLGHGATPQSAERELRRGTNSEQATTADGRSNLGRQPGKKTLFRHQGGSVDARRTLLAFWPMMLGVRRRRRIEPRGNSSDAVSRSSTCVSIWLCLVTAPCHSCHLAALSRRGIPRIRHGDCSRETLNSVSQ